MARYDTDGSSALAPDDPYNNMERSDTRPEFNVMRGGNQGDGKPQGNLKRVAQNNLKNAEESATNPISSIAGDAKSAEESTPFKSSVTGRPAEGKKKSKGFFKKAGPTIAIGGASVAAFIGFSAILTPFLQLNHIITMTTEKWGFSEYSLTRRTQKIFGLKATGSSTKVTTGGAFNTNVGNRYRSVSPKTISRLESNGFTLELGDTSTITGKSKIKSIRYNNTSYSNAGDFSTALTKDAAMRTDLNRVYKPRVAQMFDKISSKFKSKFGLKPHMAGAPTDVEDGDMKTALQEQTRGEAQGEKSAGNSAKQVVESTDKDGNTTTSLEATPEIADVDGNIRGAPLLGGSATAKRILGALNILGAAQTLCGYYQMAYTFADLTKTSGLDQMMASTAAAFSIGDQVKAGDGNTEAVSVINTSLNTPVGYAVDANEAGDVTKESEPKTGSSAQAYQYAVQATSIESSEAIDGSASKFLVGGIPAFFQGMYNHLNSEFGGFINGTCKILTNKAVVIATTVISIGLAFLTNGISSTVTTALSAANIAGTAAIIVLNVGMNLLLPTIASIAAGDISCMFKQGQDMMNCLMISAGGMAGKNAGSGGNVALTNDDAHALYIDYQEYLAEVAEEERATRNPLDVTSPYTFLGSIASSFLPYLSGLTSVSSSISNIFSSITSVTSSSIASLMPETSAFTFSLSTFKDSLSACNDESYKDIATDPFCNPIYGISTTAEPEDILSQLMDGYLVWVDEEGEGEEVNASSGRDPKIQQFTYYRRKRKNSESCSDNQDFFKDADEDKNGTAGSKDCVLLEDGKVGKPTKINPAVETDLYQYETYCALRRSPLMMEIDSDEGDGHQCVSDYTWEKTGIASATFAAYYADNRAQDAIDGSSLIASDEFLEIAYENGVSYYVSADPSSDMYIAGYYDYDEYELSESDLAYYAYVEETEAETLAYFEYIDAQANLARNGSSLKPSPATVSKPIKIFIEEPKASQNVAFITPYMFSSSKSKSAEITA